MTVALWILLNVTAALAILALIVEGTKPPAEDESGNGDTVVDLVIQPEELRR